MTAEQWENFKRLLEIKRYAKKEHILGVGRVEKYLHFVLRGSIGFFYNKDGKAYCYELIYENEFASAYRSFLTQTPSEFDLVALEPTLMISIRYENLNMLYERSKIGERLGRLCAEKIYMEAQAKALSLLTQSAEERYLHLLERSPQVLQRTPQKYIASYLGVTPESLSRIRRNIS
ncbi:MAG: Crp/Fnr family transcriptional regulator [Bacteroidia bacterium]|nr:Crp/Fnr family transcriptional regulator [Bacteroidia bacterium]